MKRPFAFPPDFTSLCAVGLVAVLSACGQMPQKAAEAPIAAEKPLIVLTEAAQQALSQAEAQVQDARARFALWTTAESALNLAREAARVGDSATVIKQAGIADDQARKGLEQLAYPGTELK